MKKPRRKAQQTNPSRPFAETGSTFFALQAKDSKQQRDVLDRLKESKANGFALVNLKQCSPKLCGVNRCREVCVLGARRQRATSIPAAYKLLEGYTGPMFEVRVSRDAWCRSLGELTNVSLPAVGKLIRRGLDSLFNPEIVAVGSIKVTVVTSTVDIWRPEAHLIIAGATRDELYKAFGSARHRSDNFLLIDAVTDTKDATTRVLTHSLHVWQHPSLNDEPLRPKRSIRAEYYRWLLPMTSGGLTFRYGCDRHFNKLSKAPRTMKPPKPRKPRPNPVWLERWQFGTDSRENMDLEKERARSRIW